MCFDIHLCFPDASLKDLFLLYLVNYLKHLES